MTAHNTTDLFNDDALEQSNSEFNANEGGNKSSDGLYRPDLSKVSAENKARGYRALIRFLPNYTVDPIYIKAYLKDKYNEEQTIAIGKNYFEKSTHYVKIPNLTELSGYYDSPWNKNLITDAQFSKSSPISEITSKLKESKNALMREKLDMITYSKKYFSYVLILEDEQQPELVGKILVYSFGKQILDKIKEEETVEKCNVYKLAAGKDFTLVIKEKEVKLQNSDKVVKMPDYTSSKFKEQTSSISLPTKEGKLRNVPLEDGVISPMFTEKIKEFFLSREVVLENFAPKAWTEEQTKNVTQIINYMTGKQVTMESNSNAASSDDFAEDITTSTSTNNKTTDLSNEEFEDFDWN